MSMENFIENILSEHLKCYILLSYDYEGNHITIHKIKNQEELDALHNAIAREEIGFADNLGLDTEEDTETDGEQQ